MSYEFLVECTHPGDCCEVCLEELNYEDAGFPIEKCCAQHDWENEQDGN